MDQGDWFNLLYTEFMVFLFFPFFSLELFLCEFYHFVQIQYKRICIKWINWSFDQIHYILPDLPLLLIWSGSDYKWGAWLPQSRADRGGIVGRVSGGNDSATAQKEAFT